MSTVCPNCNDGVHGHCIEQGCDCACAFAVGICLDDDYVFCGWCGEPFDDGGGLYCSDACEDAANGDYEQ